jgi:hypothetical protein
LASSSIRRQNIILQTNAQMARGYGQYKQGQDPAVLTGWPAQELIRIASAEAPREWQKRWTDAGGQLSEGRLIALKNDPIWRRISRFDLPYPPFDFNSGMGLRAVDQETANRLGIITEDTLPQTPQSRRLNEDLEASPKVRSATLRTALETTLRGFAAFGEDGVLRKLASATA